MYKCENVNCNVDGCNGCFSKAPVLKAGDIVKLGAQVREVLYINRANSQMALLNRHTELITSSHDPSVWKLYTPPVQHTKTVYLWKTPYDLRNFVVDDIDPRDPKVKHWTLLASARVEFEEGKFI